MSNVLGDQFSTLVGQFDTVQDEIVKLETKLSQARDNRTTIVREAKKVAKFLVEDADTADDLRTRVEHVLAAKGWAV
jgi:chromosome segregation ATPase